MKNPDEDQIVPFSRLGVYFSSWFSFFKKLSAVRMRDVGWRNLVVLVSFFRFVSMVVTWEGLVSLTCLKFF